MKGTYSKGKKSGKRTVTRCRRCGKYSFHKIKRTCSSCGFGKRAKLRKYSWKKPGKK